MMDGWMDGMERREEVEARPREEETGSSGGARAATPSRSRPAAGREEKGPFFLSGRALWPRTPCRPGGKAQKWRPHGAPAPGHGQAAASSGSERSQMRLLWLREEPPLGPRGGLRPRAGGDGQGPARLKVGRSRVAFFRSIGGTRARRAFLTHNEHVLSIRTTPHTLHTPTHLRPARGDGLDGHIVGQRDLGRAGAAARLFGLPVCQVEAESMSEMNVGVERE